MKQIAVRGVDEYLSNALKREAEVRGLSVNKLVLQLLRESVELSSRSRPVIYTDLDYLAGTWSDEEAAVFEHRLAQQRTLDSELGN